MEPLFYGVLMGWGAAIPFGPINLEMTRRNLHYGTIQGISLGLGACIADVVYLIILSLGAMTLMQHAFVLKLLGVVGSLILAWFGIMSFKMKEAKENSRLKPLSILRDLLSGLVMTLFNPFTVLFWSSMIAQIALISNADSTALLKAVIGVLIGTLSWVVLLNSLLHYTRHKLPQKFTRSLNKIGGIILLTFAFIGLLRSFQ